MWIQQFGILSKSSNFAIGKNEAKKMIKYRMIKIKDYNDETVQFACVYVTNLDRPKCGLIEEPDCLFAVMEEDE